MSDDGTKSGEQGLTLTAAELIDITHYRRPAEQLRELESLGIPARRRRHDNTICVLRAHLANSTASTPPAPRPQLRTRAK